MGRQNYRGFKAQLSSLASQGKMIHRGTTLGINGSTNHMYAMASRQDQENPSNVVSNMLKIFNFDIYSLLDPGVTLSFVTPYIVVTFEISPESLLEP